MEITDQWDNLWFFSFLICGEDLRKLKRVRLTSLLPVRGIGIGYICKIAQLQHNATFADSVLWAGSSSPAT